MLRQSKDDAPLIGYQPVDGPFGDAVWVGEEADGNTNMFDCRGHARPRITDENCTFTIVLPPHRRPCVRVHVTESIDLLMTIRLYRGRAYEVQP